MNTVENTVELKVINEQFKIIGEKLTFEQISPSGMVIISGKKRNWYEVYKFTEEQEERWRKWALNLLSKEYDNPETVLQDLELRFGFVRSYTKPGELF